MAEEGASFGRMLASPPPAKHFAVYGDLPEKRLHQSQVFHQRDTQTGKSA